MCVCVCVCLCLSLSCKKTGSRQCVLDEVTAFKAEFTDRAMHTEKHASKQGNSYVAFPSKLRVTHAPSEVVIDKC